MSTDTCHSYPEENVLGQARSEAYSLLGALLRQPPSGELLQKLAGLEWESDLPRPLAAGLQELRDKSSRYTPEAVAEEFRVLFVGLGRGEIVPYASWYLEGVLKGGPLARLRTDLGGLGIAPEADSSEPEDHAGLLCETMALLCQQEAVDPEAYSSFWQQHMTPWMFDFFRDLAKARNAGFYRAVASLGHGVLELDRTLAGAAGKC